VTIMKAWISKYALTQGIFCINAEICLDVNKKMIQETGKGIYPIYYHKPDWYETEQEAKDQAELMRKKKIASLEKQVAKLKEMKF